MAEAVPTDAKEVGADDISQALREIAARVQHGASGDVISAARENVDKLIGASQVYQILGTIDAAKHQDHQKEAVATRRALIEAAERGHKITRLLIDRHFPNQGLEPVKDSQEAKSLLRRGIEAIIFQAREQGEAVTLQIDDEPPVQIDCYDASIESDMLTIKERGQYAIGDIVAANSSDAGFKVVLESGTFIRVIAA